MPVLLAGGLSRNSGSSTVLVQQQGASYTNNDTRVSIFPELDAGTSGVIVNNVGTSVGYQGSGVYQVIKTAAGGAYDADAVSTGTITGDAEVIIDWAAGTFVAGLQYAAVPTANSGYGTIVGAYMDGTQTAMFAFGSQVGAVHAWQPYAKIAYTAADDTIRFYTSSDRLNWGSALESVASIGSPALYFDSSLNTASATFDVIFRTPPTTGTSSLTFSPSATLTGTGALAAASSLTFAPSAALTGKGALAGASTLTFAPAGTVTGKGALTGTSALAFSPAGTVTGVGALAGASALTFSATGSLTSPAVGPLIGAASIAFAAAGTLNGIATIAGVCPVSFEVAGTLTAYDSIAAAKRTRRRRRGHLEYEVWHIGTEDQHYRG